MVRYHGIFAPSSGWRSLVVPAGKPDAEESCYRNHKGSDGKSDKRKQAREKEGQTPKGGHPRNYGWAELMRRVFDLDVLKCDSCGGRMRILCAINPPEAIKKILDCLGLPSRPPPSLRRCYGGQAISAAILGDPRNF
jgi:hypothetical protein